MVSKKNNSGFTLIELLVVIAIVGVLSGVVLQSLNSARAKARNNTRFTQIDQINKALELYATGGSNKLPYSDTETADTLSWRCLGLASGTCGGTANFSFNTTVNSAIAGNIAGGVIPKDQRIPSGYIGDYYLYHSNVANIITGGGNCTATTCPAGAYLSWVVENSTSCGRGIFWQAVTYGSQCVLRIGNAVTN